MLDEGILSEDALKAIEAEVIQIVDDAVQYAEDSPKPVRLVLRAYCAHAALLLGCLSPVH